LARRANALVLLDAGWSCAKVAAPSGAPPNRPEPGGSGRRGPQSTKNQRESCSDMNPKNNECQELFRDFNESEYKKRA
jgi:hypothetical protein